MLNVKLTDDLQAALDKVAKRSKKTRSALVRDALARYLEDYWDALDAEKALKRGGRRYTLKEVMERNGLEG